MSYHITDADKSKMLDKIIHIAGIKLLAEVQSTAKQIRQQPAKLYLLHGHSTVFTISLVFGSASLQPIAVIDAANRFNSYNLSNIATYLSIPAKVLLQRTYVTRSFTAFQTEAAITTKLPNFLATHPCKIVIILGLLDTYYDEQIKPHECKQSIQRIMQKLRELVKQNIHVLITDVEVTKPPKGKEKLLQLVKNAVDDIKILKISDNGFQLKEERRNNLWDAATTRLHLP